MKKPVLSRLIAEIREDIHKEVKIVAIREGVSVKDIVEKCLVSYLSNRTKNLNKAA